MKALELTDAAETWLAATYPKSTIVRELSVADWGGALVDIAAITDDEIVGVEIKGLGDSPTRLELQGFRYGQVCQKMWLLVTPDGTLESRCHNKRPKGWGALQISDKDGTAEPKIRYKSTDGSYVELSKPNDSKSLNPWSMCGTLWRDELYQIARRLNFQPSSRAIVDDLSNMLIDQLPIMEIHSQMIRQLRSRNWGPKPVNDLRGPKPKDKGLFDD